MIDIDDDVRHLVVQRSSLAIQVLQASTGIVSQKWTLMSASFDAIHESVDICSQPHHDMVGESLTVGRPKHAAATGRHHTLGVTGEHLFQDVLFE